MKALISAAAMLIFAVTMCVPVCADSAQSGAAVSVTLYIEGVSDISAVQTTITYDAQYLEYDSYNSPYGTSVVNAENEGTIVWADIFDAVNGMDFTSSTAVFNVRFTAAEDITDVDSLIQMTVDEATDASLENIDVSCVTMKCVSSAELSSSGDAQSLQESEASTAAEIDPQEEGSGGGVVIIVLIVAVIVGVSAGVAVAVVKLISK